MIKISIACVAVCATLFLSSTPFAQSNAGNEHLVPSDSSFTIKLDWFKGTACPKNEKGQFHFQIGNEKFSTPANQFVRGILKRVSATQRAPNGRITVRLPPTAGCRSNPLSFVEVEIRNSGSTPHRVVLAETPERTGGVAPVMRYIEHLSKTGGCRPSNQPSLIVCVGSRTAAGNKINIVFLIVSEGDNKVNVPQSGIPIHARCEGASEIVGCFVSEELPNNVTAKAAIEQKLPSAEDIRQFRKRLIEFTATRRAP